ncbi:MAG: hypothetical protein WD928_16620 [Gammaproteobacteria bacterium]
MDVVARLTVIQHTSAEYLGLIEDHLEGRRIRFSYLRPFAGKMELPAAAAVGDGLILLGGGPWGAAGPHNLPTLIEEVELTHACLERGVAVLGLGLGAHILALAAGGRVREAALALRVESARRVDEQALNGYLPACYTNVSYLRDRCEPPPAARVLARGEDDLPAAFQIGTNSFGFTGHPGFKPAIAEDLVMEFEQGPANPAAALAAARAAARRVEADLIPIMTGLIQMTGWMDR